ncbi:MAG: glycosyltransferase family 4 protein [Flavobacteriales bacterium]|nr:glycosyltransferase family 4 protein [Flavobacteriales bacterium]
MKKPRVLVFIDWYHPGYRAGGPVRSLVNMVDHLRDRVDFHIVTRDTDYTMVEPYPGIEADRWTTLPGGEQVWYASRDRITSGTWGKLIHEQEWDLVYINGIYSRWFSIEPLRVLGRSAIPRVVAVRGMLATGAMAHGNLKKRLFLTLARTFDLYRNVRFQATNEEEREDIRKWMGRQAEVHLVPNLPRKLNVSNAPAREKEPGSLRLVSVARIAVEKNTLLAIRSLAPLKGEVQFELYGPIYDQAYWHQCEAAIGELPPNIRVRHRGTIGPDEVPALLSSNHLLFMPSAGENFGHTMLEALSCGTPLLISDRTPWKDLADQQAGFDLPLDRVDRFSEVAQRFIDMDQRAYDRYIRGAFTLAKRYLEDPTTVERTVQLLTP